MNDQDPPPVAARSVWVDHPGYVQAYLINLALAGWFGVTALFSPPARFAAPTYDGLDASLGVPGWGAVLLGYGTLLGIVSWLSAGRAIAVFFTGGAIYLAVAVYFAVGLPDPGASPWGPAVFVALGVWQCTQAEAYRQARNALQHRARP